MDDSGGTTQLVPITRCDSHTQVREGALEIKYPGLVKLVWDNTYSWLTEKKLVYQVDMNAAAGSGLAGSTGTSGTGRGERVVALEHSMADLAEEIFGWLDATQPSSFVSLPSMFSTQFALPLEMGSSSAMQRARASISSFLGCFNFINNSLTRGEEIFFQPTYFLDYRK